MGTGMVTEGAYFVESGDKVVQVLPIRLIFYDGGIIDNSREKILV